MINRLDEDYDYHLEYPISPVRSHLTDIEALIGILSKELL